MIVRPPIDPHRVRRLPAQFKFWPSPLKTPRSCAKLLDFKVVRHPGSHGSIEP